MSKVNHTDKQLFPGGINSGVGGKLFVALTTDDVQVDATGVTLDMSASTAGAVWTMTVGTSTDTYTTATVTSTTASKALTVSTGTSTPATAITGGATGAVTARSGNSVANHAGATGGATGAASFGSGNASSTLGTSGASGAVALSSGTSEDAASGALTIASGNAGGNSGSISLTTGTSGATRGSINLSGLAVNITLGDAAGAQKVYIKDSAAADVLVIDSDGYIGTDQIVRCSAITATGGSGGATAGTLDLDIVRGDGSAIARAVQVKVVVSSTQYGGSVTLNTNVTFATATLGTLVASGSGWALIETDATGNFACALANSSDETVYVSVENAGGVSTLANGSMVTGSVVDSATWAA